jgi:hypothetical protein
VRKELGRLVAILASQRLLELGDVMTEATAHSESPDGSDCIAHRAGHLRPSWNPDPFRLHPGGQRYVGSAQAADNERRPAPDPSFCAAV